MSDPGAERLPTNTIPTLWLLSIIITILCHSEIPTRYAFFPQFVPRVFFMALCAHTYHAPFMLDALFKDFKIFLKILLDLSCAHILIWLHSVHCSWAFINLSSGMMHWKALLTFSTMVITSETHLQGRTHEDSSFREDFLTPLVMVILAALPCRNPAQRFYLRVG